MKNSQFANLIFRIISTPTVWHDDSSDTMHKILDDITDFDDSEQVSNMEIGEKLLSRLQSSSESLQAFNTLLDKSNFALIILDEKFHPIYRNTQANGIYQQILCTSNPQNISVGLHKELVALKHSSQTLSTLTSLQYKTEDNITLFARQIRSKISSKLDNIFYLLLSTHHAKEKASLNANFIQKYNLTKKEKTVLLDLINGKTIKEIAKKNFVSENTAKTHLKSLFRKTQTNSQTEIVLLTLTHDSQVLDSYFGTSSIINESDQNRFTDKFIVIKKNKTIFFADYGPKTGYPIIVFHSGFGCQKAIPLQHKHILEKLNCRIIIPDRPGFGKSPHNGIKPTDWFNILDDFADALSLTKFTIIGSILSSSLAAAYVAHDKKNKNRVTHLTLTSPVIISEKKDAKELTGVFSPAARLVNISEKFALDIYQMWLKSMKMDFQKNYTKIVCQSLGSAEQHFLKDGTLELIVNMFEEGISLSLQGISHELIFGLSPLKNVLSEITIPVDLWYGSDDKRNSLKSAQTLQTKIPHSKLHIHEGYSEYIYFSQFESILRKIISEIS